MGLLPTDYKELTRAIMTQSADDGRPVNGTFELTSRCNLGCKMCYIRTRAGDRAMKASELTAEQWLDLARQGVDAGMLFLLLTGGEVFLRPDFFDIYEPLTDMGLLITLFTNATLITKKAADRLAKRPPNRTEVTLYGATKETYEAVTGEKGGYEKCIRGIELLLEAGVTLKLKTTLSRLNAHEFDQMRQMSENWGLDFGASWLLSKRRDQCSNLVEEIRFSPKEAVDLEALDEKVVQNYREIAQREPTTAPDDPFYCLAGKSSFVIGPSGDMNVCIDLCLPRARPTEIGLVPAWNQVRQFIRSVAQSHECKSCDLYNYCTRCPAWGYTESGDVSSSVVYLCEIAKERKQRYGNLVAV
ncbi:MAG: radical SAM protein [Chthonomonadales bacterium]|nr:radical SAM protein [Chthonomonadales bacterium]